jgi:alkylhydroperoxidase family enzyme
LKQPRFTAEETAMYRVTLPDGVHPLSHVIDRLGSDALLSARQQLLKVVYEAPGSGLTPREREAIRIPTAQNIGCNTCMAVRLWRDMPGFSAEIEEAFYQNAMDRQLAWAGFSQRESFLIEFSDRFENDHQQMNGDDAFWDRAHALFSEAEIGDALILASTFGGTGHTLNVLGIGSVCEVPTPEGLRQLAEERLVVRA